ncbi:MAG: response regulator, partial [Muribaculaceae bacterium]|nr:response regulator [Muribaculaceae bacterium]
MEYRILIVDDEKMIRMGIKNAMPWEQMGIAEVYTAASAKEAASVIEEHRPQIMITDISMAEMSGLELVGQIREKNTGMRIIVLTGYDRFEYARQALQLQVHDFLLKPIDETELKKSILAQVEQLEERRIRHEDRLTANRAQGMKQQIELESAMRSIVTGKEDLTERTELFRQEYHFGKNQAMRIGILIPGVSSDEDLDSEGFRMQTVKQICLGLIDGQKRGITFSDEKRRITMAFFCDEGRKENELAEQLIEILNDELETRPRIIWGSVKKGLENLCISYNDAVFALEHEREEFEKLCAVDWNRKGEDIFQDVFREFRNALVYNVSDKEK